jgi:hypothetical protein
MIVRSAAGSWVVPPNRALWLIADLEHEVQMCGDVKIRTVLSIQMQRRICRERAALSPSRRCCGN